MVGKRLKKEKKKKLGFTSRKAEHEQSLLNIELQVKEEEKDEESIGKIIKRNLKIKKVPIN